MRPGRSSSRWRFLLVGPLVVGAAAATSTQPVNAACHAFTVEVDPATVAEGTTVTVTVSRDAGVAPSQIDVETVDGSARGGSDYQPVARRTVSFSSETEQTFTVETLDDTEPESGETFMVHLSNPGGCAVNPNFVVGPDAQVTLTDNDDTAPSVPPSTPTTTARPTTTASSSASTTSTAVETATSSTASTVLRSTTTADVDDVAVSVRRDDDDDDGPSAAVAALAVLVVVAAAAGGLWAWRRRGDTG